MKAITIKQPWASLIVEGTKDVENRTWKCPEKYIGQRVLIHASGSHGKKFNIQLTDDQMISAFRSISNEALNGKFYFGAIIGSVEIVDCVINHPSVWAEKSKSNYSERCRNIKCEHFIEWGIYSKTDFRSCMLIGESEEISEVPHNCQHKIKIKSTYNWVLANPIKFPKPIPCRGKLRFWEHEMICPEFSHFGASYPDAHCIDGYLYDLDSLEGDFLTVGGDDICPYCNPNDYIAINQ